MSDSEVMGLAFGISFFVILIFVVILIFFLLSLSKLSDVVRVENNYVTYVSKAWVWTQLIPVWGFIAMLVYHIKMTEATRAVEKEFDLNFKTIQYPEVLGWFYALAFLYAWIPVAGFASLVVWIIYWVQVASTSAQIIRLKNQK
ncbi:MAG: hypothetical protein ACK5LP_01090 [Campylobacteraceae bacterium]